MDGRINDLQQTAGKIQNTYSKLIGPIISIIVPIALLAIVVYITLGGAFDVGALANENGVVRIPVVFLFIALPIGWLIDAVGVTAGLSIISAVLGLWLIGGIFGLRKALKGLKSAR
ncbi:MAG: hypothetical protein LBL86_03575 [Coriobacteriales bacterium]|jgi:hypothetical protein|nr:hypothetical protein [Coriobacteriales bacterium]